MPTQLVLYSTSHCHLCDLAHAIILNVSASYTLNIVDIADHEKLLAQYGLKIPVLVRTDTETALDWPFTESDVLKFLHP